jgi:hypothetical protein
MDPRNIAGAQDISSDLVWLFLLTISSPGNPDLLLVNNNEEIVSRGKTYLPYPFRLQLPEDTGDRVPVVTLQIDNIAGDIIQAVRGFQNPPTIKIEMITNKYPDIVEKSLDSMRLNSVGYDSMVIQGELSIINVLSVRFPSEDYNPVNFPGLFR